MNLRVVISIVLTLSLLLCLVGCEQMMPQENNSSIENEPINPTLEQIVEERINNMSLDEKIAQMLIISHSGYSVDKQLLNEIKTVKPGGFILFDNNISDYTSTKKFVETLQENSQIPLIISIDQEGGRVQRMKSLTSPRATNIPYMRELGDTGDCELARQVGRVIAKELRTIGVNVVYAPVVDISRKDGKDFIGERSFGTSAKLVSDMAISLANGLEQNGVVATYKHFPGHGATVTDSHKKLPVINKSLKELKSKELVPYEAAIKSGAKIIMVGHLSAPKVTGEDTPATLSKIIVTDILRKEMGYDGLVITDALNMKALTDNYSYKEIYIKAIEAGCDILLMPHNSARAVKIIKENISEERIDESVKRILMFKYENFENYQTLDETYLGCDSHQKIISKIPQ